MKAHRIYGIFLRYMYLLKHSMDRQADAFYWPTMDLLVWGLTSRYFGQFLEDNTILRMVISGLILSIILIRAQGDISINFLEELWNKNLINLFVSPLKFSEWVSTLLIISFTKATISIVFAGLLAILLYQINVFANGIYFIPFILLLFMTGWSIGFFVSSLVLLFTSKVQAFAWAMIGIVTPFSAIFYPVSALPEWGQAIARFVPSSYVFEGMRKVLREGILDWNLILISFAINTVYLILSLAFLNYSFRKVLKKGLIKVY